MWVLSKKNQRSVNQNSIPMIEGKKAGPDMGPGFFILTRLLKSPLDRRGFVAYFAACMVEYAVKHGIAPAIADRAIRQLFHASGVVLVKSDASPGKHVRDMIAYEGTTAAGLKSMKASPLAASIEQGLEAAYQKAQRIA